MIYFGDIVRVATSSLNIGGVVLGYPSHPERAKVPAEWVD